MNINKKTYLSIDELISLPTLPEINISNDGKNVVFVKNTADFENNQYKSDIWIYEEFKDESYTLTNTDIEGTSPSWSPDSKHIAYLSCGQIFLKSMDNSNIIQITDEKEGVLNFKWEPQGKGFYYVAPSKESEELRKRKEIYGDFNYVGKEYQNNSLYYIDISSTISKVTTQDKNIENLSMTNNVNMKENTMIPYELTSSKDFHITAFDISKDGEKAAFIATPSPNGDDDQNGELYILNIKSKKLHKMNGDKLLRGNVCFSPDGAKVCYKTSLRENTYYKTHIENSTLEIYNIANEEQIQPLKDFDSTITPIKWTDKGILILWQNKTNYITGLLSENSHIHMLSETSDCFVIDASITENGTNFSCIKAKSNETFEIYLNNKKITDINDIFKDKLKSTRKVISWKSSDSLEIEGVLSTPVDFDPNKKYPLLVLVHGGPEWSAFPVHSGCFNEKYPVEQFIEKGFIVLEPNYRGSSGYGNEFLNANYRNLGIGDYTDLISGVDSLIDKGIVDKNKVGVMGWSQGGYISAFCSTYSNRFKAISVGGGASDWTTYYISTDIPHSISMFLGDTPWNDPVIYAKTSPMTYIKSACTPTLIQHGESDTGVPVINAYKLYQGLKDMNIDSELVVFKMGYSPENPNVTKAIMKQNLMWFSHYILGESLENLRTL
ncbi:Dipeptidyl aminopeptidase/acylaminoacyl peptidase [Clostridium collagenovorans DSM 3089]|uniref:Dipeptidyl aminopeptidase/acylaminoacyl peptidase n=1 Tax=Clostridium collagenovorans DSM 3089 TaxID=1121306 RepID=A0A1M5V821_9CLOT|nr:S9 family peptidase [Clostridium collagenovorans]SHH71409.1 Dipeptidyl aminopeptidase/acylaminoacyl peptidase [Clostridium collagenovorans DSM 3089]